MSNLDLTHPLRLASGSHEPGSGKGCAMNLISWIKGETEISDFPECSAAPLARMVQVVNDFYGTEDSAEGFLSPEHSVIALDMAWSTVGTAGLDEDTRAIWAARITSNVTAILSECNLDTFNDHAWQSEKIAHDHGRLRKYTVCASHAAKAVYIAAGMDAVVLFVKDAIDLWKVLGGIATPSVDEVAVSDAYGRMVSV